MLQVGSRTGKVVVYGFIVIPLAVGSYIKVWELFQPKKYLNGVKVNSVEPYYNQGGDLNLFPRGYRIHVESEEKAIGFSPVDWDYTVREGDSVDAVVRKSFFVDELDGLFISDGK